jgi:hypothetical protein
MQEDLTHGRKSDATLTGAWDTTNKQAYSVLSSLQLTTLGPVVVATFRHQWDNVRTDASRKQNNVDSSPTIWRKLRDGSAVAAELSPALLAMVMVWVAVQFLPHADGNFRARKCRCAEHRVTADTESARTFTLTANNNSNIRSWSFKTWMRLPAVLTLHFRRRKRTFLAL